MLISLDAENTIAKSISLHVKITERVGMQKTYLLNNIFIISLRLFAMHFNQVCPLPQYLPDPTPHFILNFVSSFKKNQVQFLWPATFACMECHGNMFNLLSVIP